MFDDTQYPYSLVPFRQAVSMAINRSDVSKLGEYGYAPPTDAIGLNGIFPSWVTDPAVKAEAKRLATYNPDAAKKLLTENGFTYKGSKLIDPKGNPVAFEIHVISRLVGLGRLAADHHQEPAGHRHQRDHQARARLELLVSERVRDEDADAALAGRLAGLAVRVLLRQPAPERAHRVGPGRHLDRQLGALLRSQRDGPPQPVEGHAQAGRAARSSPPRSRPSG